MVAFGQGALTTQLPTDDHDATVAAINRLTVAGGTSLGQAILASLTAITGQPVSLPDPDAARRRRPGVLALGDHRAALRRRGHRRPGRGGRRRAGRRPPACTSRPSGSAPSTGTTIEVDGYQMATALNEELLTEVAETTTGTYHRAEDADALGAVYDSLDLRITTEDELVELTGAAVGIALLLLTIGGLLMINWFGRIL